MPSNGISEAGAGVQAVVDAMIPDYPPLDTGLRDEIARDVSSFLLSQMSVLPLILSLPTHAFFQWLDVEALAMKGRRFRQTPLVWRAGRFDRWGCSRFVVFAGVVKLLRSLVLLRFYEHAAVLRTLED